MISEDQGFIFEVGFNIGILAYLKDKHLAPQWLEFYQKDLENLKFAQILSQLIIRANAISTLDQEIIENWSQFILLRGFLGGLNFFREYFQSTGWHLDGKIKKVDVLYCQCRFTDENSINTSSSAHKSAHDSNLAKFAEIVKNIEKKDISIYLNRYQGKGEFLKADTLLLLRYRQEYRLLVVDASVFSLKSAEDITNLEFVSLIKRQLINEVNHLRSKSVFSRLRIDTGEKTDLDFTFPDKLKQYFTAFRYEDKESSKLIQAASYAHSFNQFLQQTKVLSAEASLIINVVGYSDRSLSTMTVTQQNFPLLESCHEIYKNNCSNQDIKTARKEVLNLIKRQAYRSFNQGKQFVDNLFNIPGDQITTISHQECLDDFSNTVDLRDEHASLIKKACKSENTFIFLTGNPGIGKTTAIAEFLKEHIDEGFLFLYVSPRKQVNLDIIDKFKKDEDLVDKRLFCLNTDSHLINDATHTHKVEYLSDLRERDFRLKNVDFIDARQERKNQNQSVPRLKRVTENTIQSQSVVRQGVIASICQGVYALIDEKISNQIIASICIQSLKKTIKKDTLEHFGQIFKGAYNSKADQVIPEKMREISKRIKHIFIMIDEITGDQGGVEFLHRIQEMLSKYELLDSRHGFNSKIIVADASIVEQNVIQQHLNDSSPEPDKIYFRKAASLGENLSEQEFKFKRQKAIAINANSYPAKSLTITYKVIVNSYKFEEKQQSLIQNDDLSKHLDRELLQDIEKLEKQEGQILVYIQNKERLQKLIEKITNKKGYFRLNKDYLEIHANISEKQRQEIQKYKNEVKIIFMTSSGSRGLSFPSVKHILVDIPNFQIENSLMEIIQVIYRGRGNALKDKEDKQLIFYLREKAVYYDSESQLSLRESLLNVLNILLLLKASIMTRIKGAGVLGRDNYLIIPIGGKSISAAGENFSMSMANLLRELKQESRNSPGDRILKDAYDQLKQILSSADFTIHNQNSNQVSYLQLQQDLQKKFVAEINQGFDNLLKWGNIEPAYLAGSLIIVPTSENKVEENYQIRLDKILDLSSQLLNDLNKIYDGQQYHNNLRKSCQGALDLVSKLREQNKSQNLEQNSQRLDQYYAFPLLSFLNEKIIKEYLDQEQETEDDKFRKILETYVRSLYSVGNVLPIGDGYDSFPFVVFSSYSLQEIRDKIFTNKYVLNSHELNILSLILSN